MFWCIFTYIIYKNSTSSQGWLTWFDSLDKLVLVHGQREVRAKQMTASFRSLFRRELKLLLIGMRAAEKGVTLHEIKIYIGWDRCFGFDWVCGRTVFLSTPSCFRSHSHILRDYTDTWACSWRSSCSTVQFFISETCNSQMKMQDI